jgi:GNAT superfamily N-acetyltransferase
MIKYRNEIPSINDYWPLYLSTGWNAVYGLDEISIERAIANSSFAVSAYSSNQLVGFARAMSDKVLYATIYDVMVLPDYQGQGIGKVLVESITKQCKGAGVKSIHLFAAENIEIFYNQLGFQARPVNMPGMRYQPSCARTSLKNLSFHIPKPSLH